MIRKKPNIRSRDPLHAEKQLLLYWEKRLRKTKPDAVTDFQSVLDRARDDKHRHGVTTAAGLDDISWRIIQGRPLTFVEYHIALANGLLMGEVPYLEFFKTRWHETPFCRGYATVKTCPECQRRKQ